MLAVFVQRKLQVKESDSTESDEDSTQFPRSGNCEVKKRKS
jgi:hypothetical protein